ncbi:MAG: hypothetical protein JNL12_02310 [Planctomycetes bacterium]|nr:hypothetical protein [Planctomycetota bacterium]
MITEPLRFLAVPLASLNLDPANARLHGEKNLETLKASLPSSASASRSSCRRTA